MSRELLDEYFRELNYSLILFPESKSVNFKTVEKLLSYIIKEKDYWQNVHSEAYNKFKAIEDKINNALRYSDSNSINQAQNELQNAINLANLKQWPIVYSKTSAAQFIKEQIKINTNIGHAAIQYLINKRLDNISSYEYFKGYINAYIFEESAKAFNEAAAAQEATLTELSNDYSSQLNFLNEEFHKVTTEWNSQLTTNITNWTNDSEEFKTQTTVWRDNFEEETTAKLEKTLSDLEAIKKTYTEKLRLEGPAKYWKDLEAEYEISGNRWRKWAIGTTLGFVVLLTLILLFQPSTQFFNGGVFDFNSLKSALIFTIISSVCIYLITLFVKLSVSSYHLARDAKERYQITHVYLSLLNENSINEAERITVLQSIFSRADTGLLKNDNGPTMPDSLSQILKLLKK